MSRKTTTWLLIVLSLVGLADSLYLTYDHGAFHANPTGYGGGLCGAESGCVISRTSALSEIPLPFGELGLPTAVLALGFYVVFIVLAALGHRAANKAAATKSEAPRHGSRLMLGLAILACAYSLTLLVYSLSEGKLCKFCAVLYVVNTGLLIVTWKALREPFGTFVATVGRAIFSRAGLIATVTMLVALAIGFVTYRTTVLAARAQVADLSKLPTVTLDTTGRPTAGPADAPVHIIEFADFECPHCRIAFVTLEELEAERDDLRVSFMHFPLDQACNPLLDRPFHPRACELAKVGECAHVQGRFFEIAPLLFEGHALPALLDKLAARGLDRPALEACMADDAATQRVRKDIEAGLSVKIGGTPAVFLNGVMVGGALPKDKLVELIERAKQARPLSQPRP